MSGLHDAFDDIVADVPVYGDLDRAIERADKEQRRQYGIAASLAAAAAVVAGVIAISTIDGDSRKTNEPIDTPTQTPTEVVDTIPTGKSDVLAVRQIGDYGLKVDGETVPGRWGVNDSRRDVWVAIQTGDDNYERQFWGKGTTAHKMPPSLGSVLPGEVAISEDAHWIAWTRPKSDVYGKNPPRVMEVVDTATGEVRWSRDADGDAAQFGAMAVTNDGVVVFAHCVETVVDELGYQQCTDARPQVWAPRTGVIRALPAGSVVGTGAPPGYLNGVSLLVREMGAHNGLLVQETQASQPQYVRVSAAGDIEVVATLPRGTLAVTADERFALTPGGCDDQHKCRWTVLSLDGGERRPMLPTADLELPLYESFLSYVVERDDLLLVRSPEDLGWAPALARCSLERAQCVAIKP